VKIVKKHHPFQISIFDNILTVSKGIVYNFYNPLNFRRVRWDLNKDYLPQEPLPASVQERTLLNINMKDYGINLPENTVRVVVYLMASFNPPTTWVPSYFYIPMIDDSWIAIRCYSNSEDQSASTFIGSSTNRLPTNIQYQSVDFNLTYEPGESVSSLFENSFVEGKAFNLCIIGQAEYVDGKWEVVQFINSNFAVTNFLNIDSFEAHNTELFDQTIQGVGDYLTIKEKKERIINNPLFSAVYYDSENDALPNTRSHRGYIKYAANRNVSPIAPKAQVKLPLSDSCDTETLNYVSPN
jgi:hypothetical protein